MAVATSAPAADTSQAIVPRLWDTTRRSTFAVLERVEALSQQRDVARHPLAVQVLRNVGGLRHRPGRELVLGLVTLGIMLATDSVVVDLAANTVAVLFVNHPHARPADASPVAATRTADPTAESPDVDE
jgi:hypothetical protein